MKIDVIWITQGGDAETLTEGSTELRISTQRAKASDATCRNGRDRAGECGFSALAKQISNGNSQKQYSPKAGNLLKWCAHRQSQVKISGSCWSIVTREPDIAVEITCIRHTFRTSNDAI